MMYLSLYVGGGYVNTSVLQRISGTLSNRVIIMTAIPDFLQLATPAPTVSYFYGCVQVSFCKVACKHSNVVTGCVFLRWLVSKL